MPSKSWYVVLTALIAIGLWTAYLLLATSFLPASYLAEDSMIRAAVRVLVVLIPAIVYIHYFEDESFLEFTWLRQNRLRGLALGCFISGIFCIPAFYQIIVLDRPFHIPTEMAIWFNWIIGSPLAEEILFRGVVFQRLRRSVHPFWAAILSAILFTLLHLPWWLWTMPSDMLVIRLLTIFGYYGLLFTLVMWIGKSLWATILPHWTNNFLAFLVEQ